VLKYVVACNAWSSYCCGSILSGQTVIDTLGISHFQPGTYRLISDFIVHAGGNYELFYSNIFHISSTIPIRTFLDGCFETTDGMMRDDLRVAGMIPTIEPYTGLGFTHYFQGGGETIDSSVLFISGADAIVDWVFVEIRSGADSTMVVQTKSALLQRDGDVVAVDGISPLSLHIPPGEYYLVVRHRNHLGIMTRTSLLFGDDTLSIDFTDTTTLTYGVDAQKRIGGVNVMWAGNANSDNLLKYSGIDNDRDAILVKIGGQDPTDIVFGYHNEDVNMDGVVRYSGFENDRDIILVNIGGTVPSAVRLEQLPE